jgi:8-oxo-dGTP diphosphatase
VAAAAARELAEETGLCVPAGDLRYAAELTFVFPYKPEWGMVVHAFLTTAWEGEVAESDEVIPRWFPVEAIPYDSMWQDCRHWLPRVLAGERLRAHFSFAADNETVASASITTIGDADEHR